MTNPDQVRFWRHVNKSDGIDSCWNWTGTPSQKYGQLSWQGKLMGAHRVSWLIHFGPIAGRVCVCHKCDNSRCVRPDHLFLGTYQDNSDDMMKKGRHHCPPAPVMLGEKHPRSKLTVAAVRAIRAMDHSIHGSFAEAGRLHGVTKENVMCVVNRKTWRHVAL